MYQKSRKRCPERSGRRLGSKSFLGTLKIAAMQHHAALGLFFALTLTAKGSKIEKGDETINSVPAERGLVHLGFALPRLGGDAITMILG